MAQQFLELDPIKFKSRPEAGKFRIYLDENTGNIVLVDSELNETPVGNNNNITIGDVQGLSDALNGKMANTNAAVAAAIAEDPAAIVDAINGEDDVFPASAFLLANTDGLTLPANTLGRNSSGQLVLHDGTTESGNIIQNQGFRLSGSWVGSVSVAVGASTGLLGSFPISASQATPGTVLRVRGTIRALFSHTSVPVGACLGLSTTKQRTVTGGVITPSVLTRMNFASSTGNKHQRIDVDARFVMTASGTYVGFSDFIADTDYQPEVFALYDSGGTQTVAENNAVVSTACAVEDGIAEAIRLYFSTTTPSTGTGHVFYDLEFIFE